MKNSDNKNCLTNSVKIFFTIIILFILLFSSASVKAQWDYVGNPYFTVQYAGYPNLVFKDDTAFVAFNDGAYGLKPSVMKYNGISWVYVGTPGFSPRISKFMSLAFDGDTPYVCFGDYDITLEQISPSVKKFDGTNWIDVGTQRFSSGNNTFQSMVIIDHIPYVAFTKNTFRVEVKKFNGINWVNAGTSDPSDGGATYPVLATNGSTLYISFLDYANNGRTVRKLDGMNWINVGLPGFETGFKPHSFALSNDTPYVAYIDQLYGDHISVKKFNGTDWVNVGIHGFTNNISQYPDIAFNGSVPYVSYIEYIWLNVNNFCSSVMKFDGLNWINVGSRGFSPVSSLQKIAINKATPYVVFRNDENSYSGSVMKFNDNPLPVELYSFNATVNRNYVTLNWSTGSETNNAGFDIERKSVNSNQWVKTGFVSGKGTINTLTNYTFTDRAYTGIFKYRLKQIDLNENFEYFDLSYPVEIRMQPVFKVSQNYPNPFNPVTQLEFVIPESGFVSLKVYDVLGNEVAVLVNEKLSPGIYKKEFDGSNYTSGIYFYTIKAGNFIQTKRMLLLK
jgi:hypothetical protein